MTNEMISALPSSWQARWINPELPHDKNVRQPASYLRRTFTAEKVENARLYITCHGLYEVYINKKRVGDFVLAPGAGDFRKRLYVQCYDVSSYINTGENEVLVTLGDGWYRGNIGIDGLNNYYGSDLALLCQLEADGTILLVSDEHWEASQEGPVRENDLSLGERYDARMEEIGGWHGVSAADFDFSKLAPTESVPVLEQERFPGRLFKTPNGETVIDFGQNLAGYTELSVTAKAGQRITLWHGETLDENGSFTQKNFDPGDRNKNGGVPQKVEYICKDGLNVYKPHFTIFGFRYAKIETDVDLADAQFTSIAVYSQMPQVGFFTCGNEDVNQLFRNALWSMRSNFCDIPTDCPTRERAGWTGDAGLFAPTAVYLMDCLPVFRKWLGELRLACGEDGLVPNIAPPNEGGGMITKMLQGSAGWGDASILVPWALYEAYGDKTILEENYEMMAGWMKFCEKRAGKTRIQNLRNPYHKYLIDEGFHFGEWFQPDVDNTETMKKIMMFGAPEVATAYYFRSAALMAEISKILGRKENAKHYAETAINARKAYRFTCTDNGTIKSDRMCEYVRPVAFGLLKKNEVPAAVDELNKLVENNKYHLNTGFLSTPDLCRVLAENGHADTAYRLLLQDECPGWLYAVKKGATTIWECWDGVRPDGTVHDSLNHYSYGAIAGWFFSGACGISLKAGQLTIAPHPGRELGFAEAEWHSPAGTIKSAWIYENDKLIFTGEVPVPAVIRLPNGESHEITKGDYRYELLL